MWYRFSKKNYKNIVFLDIDGVVNDFPNHKDKTIKDIKSQFEDFIFEEKIKLLNKLIDEVNVVFILSSYWRKHFTVKEINKLFKDCGFKGEFIDKTSNHGVEHDDRWKQIKKCIDKYNPDNYVILDNGKVCEDNPNFIRTVKTDGLKDKDIEKAIKIFKEK